MRTNIHNRLQRLKNVTHKESRFTIVPVRAGHVAKDTAKELAKLTHEPRPQDLIIQRVFFNQAEQSL